MGQILLEFDNNIKQSDIRIPLTNSSEQESGQNYINNTVELQQTAIYGIQTPLIQINNITVNFTDIVDFELKSYNVLPTVRLTIIDRYNLISILDSPGYDNTLRIQIIPPFDKAYKKINLTFYITNYKLSKQVISITGTYKLSSFTSSNFKALGNMNTYQLCHNIAKETGLGFATNVKNNDQDKRYIYCDYKSYEELLEREICFSGSTVNILDFWVDLWNNLNLADMYERYNTIDKDDDLLIWVSGNSRDITEGVVVKPVQTPAYITNHPTTDTTELFAKHYDIITNNINSINKGTDKIFSIYDENKKEYNDYFIQNGEAQTDIFNKYEYIGEVCGEYNYLLNKKCRETYLQLMNNEIIEVTLTRPLLGLMRGHKVNFLWYLNDDMFLDKTSQLAKHGVLTKDDNTQIPLDDILPGNEEQKVNKDNGIFVLDKSISGQYLIIGTKLTYYNNSWNYILRLVRPAKYRPKLINLRDE